MRFAAATFALCLSATRLAGQDTVRVRLTGSVMDSIAMAPLAGASIQVLAAGDSGKSTRSVRSDSLGRFSLDSLPVGRYLIGFYHPVLDLLGLDEVNYAIDVRAGRPAVVTLATPSPAALIASICRAAPRDSSGLLIGRLYNARSRATVQSGTVVVQWPVASIDHGTVRIQDAELSIPVDSTGRFASCALPPNLDVTIVGESNGDSTGVLNVHVAARGVVARDLFTTDGRRVAVQRVDSTFVDSVGVVRPQTTTELFLRGSARLTGSIRNEAGEPLPGARISIPDAGLQTLSGPDGTYSLAGLPAGTQSIRVRAIAHFPDERLVDLYADSVVRADVRMSSIRSVLDTIRIVGTRLSKGLAEFERRRRSSLGKYLTSLDIMKDKPMQTSDLVMRGRFISLAWDGMGHALISIHGRTCLPVVYVDRMKFTLFEDLTELDTMVRPDDIAAIEIYDGANAPMEYSRGGCVVVLIWRKPIGPSR